MIVCFLFRERDGWSVESPLTHVLYGQTRTHAKCVYSSILVFRLRQRLSLSPGSWRELGLRIQTGPLVQLPASPSSNSPPLPTHQITNLVTRLFFALAAVSSIYAWSCGHPRDKTRLDSESNYPECCKPTYRPVLLQGAYNSNIIVFTSSSHANVPLKKSAEERLSRSKAHMPASLKPLNRHSRYPYMYLHACQPWLALPLAAYDTYDD
jgi:hypothetical protein